MSFLKFWKGRPKEGGRGEDNAPAVMAEQADLEDADKKGRLKHSLSISRSGRYKAKKKERTGFLDKPDMFANPPEDEGPGTSPGERPAGRSPASSKRVSQSPAHRRTPSNPSSCREGTQISSLRLKHPPTITSQQPTAV